MDNYTFGINQLDEKIPIEKWVRQLSMSPRAYTVGFFDYCRVPLKKKSEEEKITEITKG
jgi:hypothetical protein